MIPKFDWLITYVYRSLIGDFRYAAVGVVAVAFGSLSLVVMGTLASTIQDLISINTSSRLGAEIGLGFPDGIGKDQLALLDDLKRQGAFERYTHTIEYWNNLVRGDEGDIYIAYYLTGIDSASFPVLPGYKLLRADSFESVDLSDHGALVTADVARELGLKIGDDFQVLQQAHGYIFDLRLVDIVTSTPSRSGSQVFVELNELLPFTNGTYTAAKIAGVGQENRSETITTLMDQGFDVSTYDNDDTVYSEEQSRLVGFMLNGAGVLALLVSGLGIINTIRVLIGKRLKEVAILKTLGHSNTFVQVVVLAEVGMISLIGAVLGAVLGFGFTTYILGLILEVGNIIIEVQIPGNVIFRSVSLCALTGVIFGFLAVREKISQTPQDIFRGENSKRRATIANYAVVFLALGVIAGLLVGDFLIGWLITAASIASLGLIHLLLKWVLFLLVRLPVPYPKIIEIGHMNLKSNIGKFTFPFLALLLGAATVLSVVIVNDSITSRFEPDSAAQRQGVYNVFSYADAGQAQALIDFYQTNAYESTFILSLDAKWQNSILVPSSYSVSQVKAIPINNPGKEFVFSDELPNPDLEGVYLSVLIREISAAQELNLASSITVTAANKVDLQVLGFYDLSRDVEQIGQFGYLGPLISASTAYRHFPDAIRTILVKGYSDDPKEFIGKLDSQDSVQAFTLSSEQYNSYGLGLVNGLADTSIAIALLLFVGATVLIINIVSLEMLKRRKNIAVFKVVGYSFSQILTITLFEFGFIGGLVAVLVALFAPFGVHVVNGLESGANLELSVFSLINVLTLIVILTFFSIVVAGWQDLKVKPMNVLQEE